MRKSYWFGWAVAFISLGLTLVLGSIFMADVFTATDPFSGDSFMTVGGQTLLLGIGALIPGVLLAIYGLIFGRSSLLDDRNEEIEI